MVRLQPLAQAVIHYYSELKIQLQLQLPLLLLIGLVSVKMVTVMTQQQPQLFLFAENVMIKLKNVILDKMSYAQMPLTNLLDLIVSLPPPLLEPSMDSFMTQLHLNLLDVIPHAQHAPVILAHFVFPARLYLLLLPH